MRIHPFLVVLSFVSNSIFAQEISPLLYKSFELDGNYQFHSLMEAPDGRLFAAGQTQDDDPEAVLVVFDIENDLKPQLPTSFGKGVFYDQVLLPDGNFLLTGYKQENKKGWFCLADEQGRRLEEWPVDHPNSSIFQAEVLSEDTVIVAGNINGGKNGKVWVAAWVGNLIIWQNLIEKSDIATNLNIGLGRAQDMVVTRSGDIAITGIFKDEQGFWVAILDHKSGRVLRAQPFTGKFKIEPNQIIEATDGSFLLAGTIYTDTKRGEDAWLAKLSPDLQKLDETWRSGNPHDAKVLSAGLTLNGDVVMAGETYESSSGGQQTQGLFALHGKDGSIVNADGEKTSKGANAWWDQALISYDGSVYVLGSKTMKKDAYETCLAKYKIPMPDFADGGKDADDVGKIPFEITVNYRGFEKGRSIEPGATAWVDVTVKNSSGKILDAGEVFLQPTGAINPKYKKFNLPILLPGQAFTKQVSFKIGKNVATSTQELKMKVTIAGMKQELPTLQLKAREPQSAYNIVPLNNSRNASDRGPDYRAEWILSAPNEFYANNIVVLHNGKPVALTAKDQQASFQHVQGEDINGKFVADFGYTFTLQKGGNIFKICLVNPQGDTVAWYQDKPIQYDDTRKPNLHLICIGPKYKADDLQFTSEDAVGIMRAFANQSGEKGIFKSIDFIFIDSFAAGINIELEFQQLLDRYHRRDGIYPGDLVLVFNSSHGKIIDDKYYIFPYGYKKDEKKTLVDYQVAILEPLRQIADSCKVITLIDACFSGGAKSDDDEAATLQHIIADWESSAPGITTIASSGKDEKSYEYEKNGIFTTALLEALKDLQVTDDKGQIYHADADSDRYLSLQELYDYLGKRVPQLAKDKKGVTQTPVMTLGELDAEKIRIYNIKN